MRAADELVPVLKKLKLSGVLNTLELRAREAADDNLPFSEFLFRLLSDEVERREAKQLALRLSRASFEHQKTIEDFDFTFNRQIPKARIIELATTTFVARKENVCLIGPAGTGKSHIAQALGHRACRAGYTVLFTPAHQMLKELKAARADHTWDRRVLRFTGPDLLILDDLGLRPLDHDEPMDLYEVIRQRYERGSIAVTSNRAMEEWTSLFTDALMAQSALDRLMHYAHVVVMEGQSYRNPPKTGKEA
jgi:DNA replication protein DnaC